MTQARPKHHTVRHPKHTLLRDLIIIVISIGLTVFLLQTGLIDTLIRMNGGSVALKSFIAGFFFTSVFTIAPASVVLADVAHYASPYTIAFWGALGSALGDLVLFTFIKDNLADDLTDLIKHSSLKRFFMIFRLRIFRWLIPLIGALIIASPLPDEIGLTMMGLSKTRKIVLIPVAFVMSYVGILALVLIAQTL